MIRAVRKQNPSDVVDAFVSTLSESLATWTGLRRAVGESGPLAKQASVDAFLRAAVAFETLRSDWHVAAINRDSSAFKVDLASRVEQSVRGRWPSLVGRVRIDLPAHPSLSVVRQLLDPLGRNVSLSDAATWKDRAFRELANPYRDRVLALPREDDLLVNGVIAIRDLLVHRSQAASDAMNAALAALHRAASSPRGSATT